jgi:putative membrane protein
MTISMAGLPAFLLYFMVGTALIVGFAAIYWKATAHDEIALIRAGNLSAAIAFGGSLAGFSIPLEKAIEQAASIPDLVIWAVVAMAIQIGAYALVRWIVPDLSRRIEENQVPAAAFLAVVSVICGTLAGASMTE